MPFQPRSPVPKHQPHHPPPSPEAVHPTPPAGQVWVVDQIEEGIASVEVDGHAPVSIPVWILPRGVHEGDVLRVTIAPDPEEQARRLARSREQVSVKSKHGSGGDIVL